MKMSMDCIPCFVRQAADTVKMSDLSDEEQKRLMQNVLQWISELDFNETPPAVSQSIHRRLRSVLPTDDPYRTAKDMHNKMAAGLITSIRQHIKSSSDPLMMAVRYAISGNIIDLGSKNNISHEEIYVALQNTPLQPIYGDTNAFKKAVQKAKNILYLADNAGEIFFDRLLIEQLPGKKITMAVRGAPVINDATITDARAAKIDDIAEIIDNGSDAPGTILNDCDTSFRRRFEMADMVIAKGQGNFETLSDEQREIFFLFRIKCPTISYHSGFCVGSYVVANRFSMPDYSSGAVL